MFQNHKLNLKKLNGKNFSFYCLIFVLVIKCCFCTIHLSALEDGKQKATSLDPEEIIRRRNLIETYLKEKSNPKDNWIETYHGSYSGKSHFIPQKTKQTGKEQRQEASVQNPEKSDNLHESFLKKINSDEDPTLKIKLENLEKTDEVNNSQMKCFESSNFNDSNIKLDRNLFFSPISSNFKNNYNLHTKIPENPNKLHESSSNERNLEENPMNERGESNNEIYSHSEKNPMFKLQSNNLEKVDESNNIQKSWVETYHFSYSKSKLKRNLVFSPISSDFKNNYNLHTKIPENSNKLPESSSNERNSEENPMFKLQLNNLKKVDESNNNQKSWIETYHFSYSKSKREQNLATEFCKEHSQERLYILRWINKLQKKLKNADNDVHSLSILISVNLHEMLLKHSQEFDIVILDELVSNIISNATLHNNFENTLHFDYKNAFKYIYLSLNYNAIYIFMIILFLFFVLTIRLNNNRGSHDVTFLMHHKWILISILLSITFSWHAYKMYQLKIAHKHSVISRVVPSYCENILHKESGIFAHFKEFFRQWWHDEDCKQYYEAVMVDPVAEITLLSVSIDLLSHVIFQILQPVGHHMNSFFKVLTYQLSFTNKIFVIILTCFILIAFLYFCMTLFLAYYCKFRITFPFSLGSAEPTEFSVGSRVQEIEDKGSSLKDLSLNLNASLIGHAFEKIENRGNYVEDLNKNYNASLVNYENENQVEDINLKENSLKTKPKHLLELSKCCAIKATRTRSNSI